MKHSIIILALSATMTVPVACSHNETQRSTKAPTRVTTEVLGDYTDNATSSAREYVGIVEESQSTAVSFTSMGTVRQVLVSEGQAVSRGQLLAEMDDTQARNMLAAAEASLAQAEDALHRYGMLHERGSITDAQWVDVQSKVAQARSQKAIAQQNVADCRLTAPVSGVIGRKAVEAGETAMPSQAVVTILDISNVKVKFSVPEAEVATITATTPTRINVDAIGREYAGGRIERGVQADALTHTYDFRVRVNNKEGLLLPGMVATVYADSDANADSKHISVPLTSVQRRPDGSLFVWTIAADSAAHRITVVIGQTVGNRVEVSGNLAAGQRIVTEGYQKLSEGTKTIY